MVLKFLDFIRKPTSKNIIINTLGNYLNVFFTALFALLLVRIINPSQYGVLSVLLGIAYVLANVLDFGTTATIYSYLPSLYEKKSANLFRFIKSTFFYQSLFSFAVIIALFISFPYLDKVFFKTHAPPWELYLTAISVLFFIWQNFVSNILFAAKKFFKANLYINLSNLVKTIIILVLAITKTVTVGSIIFVFGILGPAIFFLLLVLSRRDLLFILWQAEIKKEDFRFGYTLTYFVASQFFNLGLRMDLFLLSYFLIDKSNVGFYGLSQKIILTVLTTVISITQVLSPSFSNIKTKKEVISHSKHSILYLLIPTALFVVLTFLPSQIFELFFTDKYVKTADITRSLSPPFIIYSLGSLPMLFLLYTVKKPTYILISNVIFFFILSFGAYWLIPIKGVFGPPLAILGAFVVAVFIQSLASIYEFRKLPD